MTHFVERPRKRQLDSRFHAWGQNPNIKILINKNLKITLMNNDREYISTRQDD